MCLFNSVQKRKNRESKAASFDKALGRMEVCGVNTKRLFNKKKIKIRFYKKKLLLQFQPSSRDLSLKTSLLGEKRNRQ